MWRVPAAGVALAPSVSANAGHCDGVSLASSMWCGGSMRRIAASNARLRGSGVRGVSTSNNSLGARAARAGSSSSDGRSARVVDGAECTGALRDRVAGIALVGCARGGLATTGSVGAIGVVPRRW